jgi:hypothetical protein
VGGGRTLSANTMTRCSQTRGFALGVEKTRIAGAETRDTAAGDAELATTHTLHLRASALLAWACVANPNADQNVSTAAINATDLTIARISIAWEVPTLHRSVVAVQL